MISNALVSCGYLLIGSSYAVYRLISHSNANFLRILPQFIYASIGIATISARSVQNLIYNLVWRRYPIDPILAEQEQYNKFNNHLVNWGSRTLGFSCIFHSLCLHYNFTMTGPVLLSSLVICEIMHCLKKKQPIRFCIEQIILSTNNQRLESFMKADFVPYVWIIFTEFLGLIAKNNFIRLANIPFSLTTLTYRPRGFNHEWSVRCSMNDYMMLAYIIFMTEALCQT